MRTVTAMGRREPKANLNQGGLAPPGPISQCGGSESPAPLSPSTLSAEGHGRIHRSRFHLPASPSGNKGQKAGI
jgi:hypothetical protein